MSDPKKPTTKPVATAKRGQTTYKLYANGELWTTGPHGFLCGYVSDPEDIDAAIYNHEEEIAVMWAQARAEFGGQI